MPSDDTCSQKKILRESMQTKRLHLSTEDVESAAQKVLSVFSNSLLYSANRIAAYYPTHNELNVLLILKACLSAGKHVFLPRVDSAKKKLHFHRITHLNELTPGTFGIPEPSFFSEEAHIHTLNAMLLPAVAVDSNGYRLGTGGGFYDRTLSEFSSEHTALIGCVYSWQHIATVPHDEWDIQMHFILSENGIYSCKQENKF